MPLDFAEIPDGESFELFCETLLRALGFDILSAPGRGADSGVDMIIRSPVDPNLGISNVFLIQCKHFAHSGRAVGVTDLGGISPQELVLRFSAQGYILITSTIPSQSLQDHFNALGQKTGLHFKIWDRDFVEARLAAADDANIVHRYFRESGQFLRDSLLVPPRLPSWEILVSTLHARALTDIAQTIGQKYIPDLYVTRLSVETYAQDFAATTTSRGRLITGFKEFSDSIHEFARSAQAVHERALSSKLNTLEVVTHSQKIWSKESLLEEQRESYRKVLKETSELANDLSRLTTIAEECRQLVTPANNLYAYTRSKATHFLHLVEAQADAIKEYFDTIHSEIGKTSNIANEGRGRIREKTKTAEEREANKKISSYLDSIAGSCEELLSATDIVINKLAKAAGDCKSLKIQLNSVLAIIERAGRGKTNLLCDLASRIGRHTPVFFIAAKSLPLSAEDPITRHISERLQTLPGFRNQNFIAILAQLAHTHNSSVVIIIDGINESVDPFAFANNLHSFLAEIEHVTIRIMITCREEYWGLFRGIDQYISVTLRDGLGFFTGKERDLAIRKYFTHYQISTSLNAEPLQALRDPLLLRFFCEAYGKRSDAVGPRVEHIRLKLLFDEYKRVKYSQIASQSKEYRSADAVSAYVDNIARALLRSRSTSLDKEALAGSISEHDLNSVGSLYSRLLDEDIVLEQRYIAALNRIVVNFTYEAFMEYVLGGIVASDHRKEQSSAILFLSRWLAVHDKFPNLAGVIGFFLAFLFEESQDEFFEISTWLSQTKQDQYLYALRIGLDNLPPDEFDHRMISLLVKRLEGSLDHIELKHRIKEGIMKPQAQLKPPKKENPFSPEEARRILIRCPSILSGELQRSLTETEPDTSKDPLLWASIFEHFGSNDWDLMWESIRLRFSISPPLRLLSRGQVTRMFHWCKANQDSLKSHHAQIVIRQVIKKWQILLPDIKSGSHGGLSSRTEMIEKFVAFLSSSLT
ncbi:MAG: restriction endonuclease [Thermoanaerobaculia bacterium]